MKNSQFNTFFWRSDALIGFNSFTQEFISLDPLLKDLYDVGAKKRDFSELFSVHPTFYDFLVEKGFLVEDDRDEFEEVKALSRKVDHDDTQFHMIVNPTMNCNFKCWYCYETHVKDSKMSGATVNAIIIAAQNIIQQKKELKGFTLTFFGGEPLLYFDKVIVTILESIHLECKRANVQFGAGMTTNGLLINSEMLAICKMYGLDFFQITLDGNKERHDKVRFISEGRGSYDRIVQNIHLVVKAGLHAHVRINCSPQTMAGINDIVASFEDIPEAERVHIHFNFQKVWQETEDIDPQIKVARNYFAEKGFSVSPGTIGTVVDSCYADKKNQLTINYNGEIFKCTARDFTDSTGEGRVDVDGSIVLNDRYEKRLNAKFNNPPCRECRILPLCGGGCSQQALEHEGVDYCIYNFDEDAKTRKIVDRFNQIVATL
ncbi:MAG: radical SAM protein [Bacteroidetes bacterium]|nr:radical SAM protein [Bacteroidota bacterium]